MYPLRIGIGRIRHESNSFIGTSTTYQDFQSFAGGIAVGEQMLTQADRQDEVTGFVEAFRDHGRVEVVPLLSATTPPSGLITQEAIVALESLLRRELQNAGELDGICFAPHGAMSGEIMADADGHFLEVIRAETGEVPIVCSLDCHAVVTRKMVELTSALTAYRTHPHTDVVQTGKRAARILLDALEGRTKPVLCYEKLPMLFGDPGTDNAVLRGLFDTFAGWDTLQGVIGCSLCPSYPFQDVPEQGWTALAVTDDDQRLAERLARELAAKVWGAREKLLPKPMLAPTDAIREAAQVPGNPIIVTDSADNVGSGAPGDTPTILQALLDARDAIHGLALIHIPDPQAVSIARTASIGDPVTLEVGGKRDGRFGRPVLLTGLVSCLAEGSITDDGGFGDYPTIDVGVIVCLAIDNVRLVLTERVIKGPQPSLFRKVGIEPFDAKIVVVKSGIGYEVTYGQVAKAILHADCPGPGSRNLANFEFGRVPRPMFPLDPEVKWPPIQTGL